jgi:hypothetical protein
MNGLCLPDDMLWGPDGEDYKKNIMTMRTAIARNMLDRVRAYIDDIYSKQLPEKKAEIDARVLKPKSVSGSSFSMFYKGVELPVINKTVMTLDGIDYVPVFQIVDNPVHSQKGGKFIIVKTNMRNAFIKLMGDRAFVLTKKSTVPLLIYMFRLTRDVDELCDMLHFERCHESEAAYAIPDIFSDDEDDRFVYIRPYERGYWKDYLLSPFVLEAKEQHEEILRIIRRTIVLHEEELPCIDPRDIITKQAHATGIDATDLEGNEDTIDPVEDSSLDIEDGGDGTHTIHDGAVTITLAPQSSHMHDETWPIIIYHEAYSKSKCTLTKAYVAATLVKLITKDVTLSNMSVFDFIVDSVVNDNPLPIATTIGDLNQKMLRFMEWFPMKISTVQSYPDQSMVMEVAKVEQRLVYDNNINPLSELAMMSRANLFGKGGLPRESCQASVRNIHESYFNVIDPIDSPSGMSVGISLHIVPEIHSFNLQREVAERSKIRRFARG